jgi:uncharacterized 2Fe-2S/4Fe-4S cluster protein (DUF4445 family)
MAYHHIDFEPVGRRGDCAADQTLLECARQLGVDLVAICGGEGTCEQCKVQVLEGRVSEPTPGERQSLSADELQAGYRLACRTYPLSDCRLCVPPESLTTPQRTQVEGLEIAVAPESPVTGYRLELVPPSLSDLRADADRLLAALREQGAATDPTIDLEVLHTLSPRLRGEGWNLQAAVRGQEVVATGPWSGRQLGLAVDIGTTKIAGYLVDLENAQVLAAQGLMNPQISYGEDVIARIARTRDAPSEAARLQELVVEALNQLAAGLCAGVRVRTEEIVEAVVVGNTAMHHLFLRLPAEQLAMAPYVPAVSEALDVKARDVGLRIAPGAYVHLLPNIAGFVGADHVAMLLATEVWQMEGLVLALDIGTNTEVCLVSDGRMASASCASGPAFEGAHIKQGMRAAQGAIEHVRLVGDLVEYQTIGEVPPIGLCGSGILDALAQLTLAGVIDRRGKMGDHPRVREGETGREFVLAEGAKDEGRPAICITQRDVRELQLAKGAIRTGILMLLEEQGRTEKEIERVIIAGAFGTYIDVSSAIAIGMLPPLPLDRFRQVGNAAGMGAKLALTSRSKRAEAQAIARRVAYLELATAPGFMQTFMQSNYLGQ